MKKQFFTRACNYWTYPILLFILILGGCNDDKPDGTIALKLDQSVGQQEVTFDQVLYDAPAGHTFSVITLKYYLSRLSITSDAGTQYDLTDLVYRDAREPQTELVTFDAIPNGTYNKLEFIFGLDEVMNVDGGLENTVENINMEWPIPGDQGYHYMKFEGKYDFNQTGEIRSFNIHLGATSGNQNYFNVALTIPPLSIDGNDWEITLNMDLAEWLQDPNTYDFEEFGPAIMMNQTAQQTLKENGETVFSVASIRKMTQ